MAKYAKHHKSSYIFTSTIIIDNKVIHRTPVAYLKRYPKIVSYDHFLQFVIETIARQANALLHLLRKDSIKLSKYWNCR